MPRPPSCPSNTRSPARQGNHSRYGTDREGDDDARGSTLPAYRGYLPPDIEIVELDLDRRGRCLHRHPPVMGGTKRSRVNNRGIRANVHALDGGAYDPLVLEGILVFLTQPLQPSEPGPRLLPRRKEGQPPRPSCRSARGPRRNKPASCSRHAHASFGYHQLGAGPIIASFPWRRTASGRR